MLKKFVASYLRHSRVFLLVAILMTVPCVYWTALLYGNLKPDMEELLPKQSRAVLDLDEIRARMRSIQRLNILVYSENAEAGRKFTDDLAAKLKSLPESEVADVEYKIDQEIAYFSDRKVLFLELRDLSLIRNYIRDKIEYERELYNPVNIFSERELKEPNLDFRSIEKKYQSQSDAYSHFPGGYYATPDGKKRVVMVSLPSGRAGVNGVHAFKKQIEDLIASLNPKSYAPDLTLRYAGQVQDIIEEYSSLLGDIERSAQVVFSIVLIALLVFFRSFWAVGALLVSIFIARFWGFGAAWFLIGSLNANSAFMGSIVLGSGITFGVMLLARYLEERRHGHFALRSMFVAMTATARSTWAAAICTGFSYGSLYLTEFEGFRQYGAIGLVAMVLCWLGAMLVLPAVIMEIERFRPLVKPGIQKPRRAWVFGPLTWCLGRYPKSFLLGAVALSAFSFWQLSGFTVEGVLEKDLSKLRSKLSMEHGSGFYARDVDEIMHGGSSPVVALAYSQESAEKIASRLREQQAREGSASLIQNVSTLQAFVPTQQVEKVQRLQEIKRLLTPQVLKNLGGTDKVRVDLLLNPKGFDLITKEALPGLVKNKFTEKDGSVGNLVLVDPRDDSSYWSGFELNAFVATVRDTADEVEGKKVPVAGGITVTSDMIASIIRDGPKATLFAFLSVVVLLLIQYPSVRTAGWMLGTLLLGVLWMVGIAMSADVKVNFLNFIALPITFGIGVDYGVNLLDRYHQDPDRDILKIVRETGGAVGLCSFTTVVGYLSLVIAQNQAFVSFGMLAVLGETMTAAAAILALPAAILVFDKKAARPDRKRFIGPLEPPVDPAAKQGWDLLARRGSFSEPSKQSFAEPKGQDKSDYSS